MVVTEFKPLRGDLGLRGRPQLVLKALHVTQSNWPKKVTQHLIMVTQNDPQTF
jgi:hypothetical protein